MKYIKNFENIITAELLNSPDTKKYYKNLLSTLKYKIGDYVRSKNSNGIYIIDGIDTNDIYFVYHMTEIPAMLRSTFERESQLTLVPDYEVDAIKYNI